ncbi:MAG: N-methyl-D-aspartate receptor NMDAR2C subunit [Candidatus Pacebacteria bacterium]|nr:N-methyl-D-aspartate receptor NMDAR2C subunit [Candidatus Paceibacterota bacterium]
MESPESKSLEKSEQNEQILSERFDALWQRVGANPENAHELFGKIIEKYGSNERAYHNLDHIKQCLQELDGARDLANDANAIEMAIWFHDLVYDTRRKDNEEKSAEEFFNKTELLLPEEFRKKVVDLILATKHQELPEDLDSQIMVDIDLTILGQPEEKFNEYEAQIREEYSWVSQKDFLAGRKKVLESFLGRQKIYLTDFFRSKYEAEARANLDRSVQLLSQLQEKLGA